MHNQIPNIFSISYIETQNKWWKGLWTLGFKWSITIYTTKSNLLYALCLNSYMLYF